MKFKKSIISFSLIAVIMQVNAEYMVNIHILNITL